MFTFAGGTMETCDGVVVAVDTGWVVRSEASVDDWLGGRGEPETGV